MNFETNEREEANSNTPLLNTSIKMDYLAFTVSYSFEGMEAIRSFFDNMDFEELSYGGMGYAKSAVIGDGGRIYWHPERQEMGIHVRLGGKALGQVSTTALGLLNRVLDWKGKFKRIDIAFDDLVGLLDIDHMHHKILIGEAQSRWRRVTRIAGAGFGRIEKLGDTVNIGRRSSQSFLRIYDKLLEQQGRGKDVAGIDHWVRVELELKGEKANVFGGILAVSGRREGHKTAGELCASLLYGLIDFKERYLEDSNVSRWETTEWWAKFIGKAEKMKLSIAKQEKTMDDSKEWIEKTVSSTLSMIVLAEDDDRGISGYQFIMNCIYSGQYKLSKEQKRRLDQWNDQQNAKRGDNILPEE